MKKTLAMLLAFAVCLGLAACGGGGNSAAGSNTPAPVPTQASTPTPAAAPAPTPGTPTGTPEPSGTLPPAQTPAPAPAPTAAPTPTPAAPTGTPGPSGTLPPAPTPAPTLTPQRDVPGDPIVIPQDEWERAVWYGFAENIKNTDRTVTWAEYTAMLGRMIARFDPDKLAEWNSLTAKAPAEPIKRDGAAIALFFAGRTLGIDHLNASPNVYLSPDADWGSRDYPIFPWTEPVTMKNHDYERFLPEQNAIGPSYAYLCGRISVVTGQPMLDFDGDDPHLKELLTYRDAAVSAVRMYESEERNALSLAEALLELVKDTPAYREILKKADARRAEILSTKTQIVKSDTFIQGETYTGTAYYISNSGNDRNDGKSPETAWATTAPLARTRFQFGDAIFFERGGLWRMADIAPALRQTEGLTISAYGEGEKPRLYGSPENGTGAEKWKLIYKGPNGEKVWQFCIPMPECAAVVLNGKEIIIRDVPYWDGTNYVHMDDLTTVYVPERDLKDMECFVRLPYEWGPVSQPGEHWEELLGRRIHVAADGTELTGPLYVRCDAGNPGALYGQVEFMAAYRAMDGMRNYTTLDNLSFRYSEGSVGGGYFGGVSTDHLIVQNCEAGWLGGSINYYYLMDDGAGCYHHDGGGFNLNGSWCTIRNCYSHHIYQESGTLETFNGDPDPCVGFVGRDNLVEYALMGTVFCNWQQTNGTAHELHDAVLENNIILFPGFENLYNHEFYLWRAASHWTGRLGAVMNDAACLTATRGGYNCTVRNNIFGFSVSRLLKVQDPEIPAWADYEGNTYAPLPGFPVLWELEDPWGPYTTYTDDAYAVREYLRDQTGTILHFNG